MANINIPGIGALKKFGALRFGNMRLRVNVWEFLTIYILGENWFYSTITYDYKYQCEIYFASRSLYPWALD